MALFNILKSYSSKNNISHHHQLVFIDSFYYRNKLNICGLSDVLYDKYSRYRILIAGSCNGLLCIVVDKDIPVIVNPLTRIWNRLSPAFDKTPDNRSFLHYVVYGFGYDQSSDDYKLVALTIFQEPNEVKIYSLKTGKWKKIGDSLPPRGYPVRDGVVIYLNGALHWLAKPYVNKRTIVSLDLATETFGQVLQPEYDEEIGNKYLGLGALGERLCMLIPSHYEYRSDIWVMNVYGVKDSWTKLVSVRAYLCKVPLIISDDGKTLLVGYQGGLAVYDVENSSYQNIIYTFEDASVFVASMVSPHHRPVSLSSIKGTGPDGGIVKADIEEYLASVKKDLLVAPSKADQATVGAINYTDIPNSQIRKVTASRLLLSTQTLTKLRGELNSLQEASGGRKNISINDLVIKAAALALRKVPQCNSSWTNDYIRQFHDVHINVAVQTDNGVFVPVIRDADKKGLSSISEDVKNLAKKARENSLKPADYEGGTFTVSNLGGPFGIKQFCAIINPPQAGILAVGSAERRVIPGSGVGEFKFASYMSVTLSCDHRVIDGAIGAEWLKAFKGYIENPETMLL